MGEALDTELAKVMELQDDGVTFNLRAGVGWQPGIVGRVLVKAEVNSSEGYALRSGKPVSSANIDTESRFAYAEFVKKAGVKALINVIIIGGEGYPPCGILQVDSRRPREFVKDDVAFLRSYANLIAAAVEWLRISRQASQT